MPKTKNPRYLQKRYRRWYVAYDIPKDVRSEFDGQVRFVKSLQTESETVAERLAKPIVFELQERIARIRRTRSDPKLAARMKAEEWRKDLEAAEGDERETLEMVLEDHVRDLKLRTDEDEELITEIVMGRTASLADHVDAWASSLRDQEPKTVDMKRSDARRFAAALPYSHRVTRASLTEWVERLQDEENLSAATVRRILSACRGYWTFLYRRGVVKEDEDVFNKVAPKKQSKSKSKVANVRKPFTPGEVVDLLDRAKAQDDRPLIDVIWIAMWTGCRIEEVCSLKVTDVEGDLIRITDAKTAAGWREVPVHPKLRSRLEELVAASKKGYVISEANSKNKYGKRSNAIGKRFGRLKSEAGHGRDKVFHSIRHTVATQFEHNSIPENVAADIVGHEKKTMTYGLYSGGSSFELKMDAICKLSYPLG